MGSRPESDTSTMAVEERLHCLEINRIYDEALSELPDKCRAIMLMSRKEHLSNKEIAARLDISVKTVENQITIGLRHIRARLGSTSYCSSVVTPCYRCVKKNSNSFWGMVLLAVSLLLKHSNGFSVLR
ncbi:hypothetical protein MKQ70_07835 [Chitinophaga sedimenti]|nr:hypothetical protein [Chitinophaga sedimenti]